MHSAIIAALAVALTLTLAAGVVAASRSEAQPAAVVQLRLWEHEDDASRNWISVRPHGAPWGRTTPRFPLDDGHSPDGRYRYGELTIESALPEPVPTGVYVTQTSCARDPYNPVLTLRGTIHNVTDATISEITVTAAQRDPRGVEVTQAASLVLYGISPWGQRAFAITFYGAPEPKGTCHVLGLEYRATARGGAVVPAGAAP